MWNKMGILKQALDASWLKNRAISNNIANVNTPKYIRQDVEFESVLRSYMGRADGSSVGMYLTDSKHMDVNGISLKPTITQDTSGEMRIDGNNVDIDKEMAYRTENDTQYSYLSRQISDEFKRVRLAIRDGR